MRKPRLIALSLICALAISGCATSGQPSVSPLKLPPVPANLMQPPTGAQELQSIFFEPSIPSSSDRTIKSDGSKQS